MAEKVTRWPLQFVPQLLLSRSPPETNNGLSFF